MYLHWASEAGDAGLSFVGNKFVGMKKEEGSLSRTWGWCAQKKSKLTHSMCWYHYYYYCNIYVIILFVYLFFWFLVFVTFVFVFSANMTGHSRNSLDNVTEERDSGKVWIWCELLMITFVSLCLVYDLFASSSRLEQYALLFFLLHVFVLIVVLSF